MSDVFSQTHPALCLVPGTMGLPPVSPIVLMSIVGEERQWLAVIRAKLFMQRLMPLFVVKTLTKYTHAIPQSSPATIA